METNYPEGFVENTEKKKFDELRSASLENLQKYGILETKVDSLGKRLIILNNPDLFSEGTGLVNTDEGIKKKTLGVILSECAGGLKENDKWGKRQVDRTLYYLFNEEKILTKDEFGKQRSQGQEWSVDQLETKSFFYIPENVEAAYDVNEIRESKNEFYFIFNRNRKDQGPEDIYPTKDKGLESGLRVFDASIAMMVYGLGMGERDRNGVLWVDSTDDRDTIRRKISANWFKNEMGYCAFTGWGGNKAGKEMLVTSGSGLVEKGLLLENDFINYEKKREVVGTNGMYFENGMRYYLGRSFAGCSVERISPQRYIVYKESNNGEASVKMLFDPRISNEVMPSLVPFQLKGENLAYYVPANAVAKDNREFIDLRTLGGDGRRSNEKINLKETLPELVKFRKVFLGKFGSLDDLNATSMDVQIGLCRDFNRLGDQDQEEWWKVAESYGFLGIRYLSDKVFFGGVFNTALGIGKLEVETGTDLLEKYALVQDNLDAWKNETLTSSENDPKMNLMFDRVVSAFKYKTTSLVEAAVNGDERVIGQLELIRNALYALRCVNAHNNNYQIEGGWINNTLKGSEEVTSATAVFGGKGEFAESKLTVTFRPMAVTGEKGKDEAQARANFRYVDRNGNEFKFRVDLDQYGMSLDVGGYKTGTMSEILTAANKDHHTAEPFDTAFSNPMVFASLVRRWSRLLGYDFTKK